jgi:methionyl-tRNA formyltransferase
MIIQLLVDNVNSWFVPYARKLNEILMGKGYHSSLCFSQNDLRNGDILFILSCESILSDKILAKNKSNFVIHGSNLPEGRGWSPLTWEVLQGRSSFCLTLFEARNKVDSGSIFLKSFFNLEGHELIEEIKSVQGLKIIELTCEFLEKYPSIKPYAQDEKAATYYPKRRPSDGELCLDKTIREQFNLLRVSDNERYPAFFYLHGQKYLIKIYKEKLNEEK